MEMIQSSFHKLLKYYYNSKLIQYLLNSSKSRQSVSNSIQKSIKHKRLV